MNELLSTYSKEIDQILAKYPPERVRSAVIPLLYLAQRKQGAVSQSAIQEIAKILKINATEVASIAGFYTLFHEEGGGRYRIQICTDLPCALRGADEFLKQICDYLGVKTGETTTDGLFTIEEVKCLAACHRAPMFQLQGDGEIVYYEDQSLETVKALIEHLRIEAGKEADK